MVTLSKTEKRQATEFLFLLERIPKTERVKWFETWISPGIENSEIQRGKLLERMRKEVGNEGNENQETLKF